MPTTPTKTFDAVEMSRRLREETSRKLATLTRQQRIALLNAHLRAATPHAPAGAEESCILREEPPTS